MTDRYPFRYTEVTLQKKESGFFLPPLEAPLLAADIMARLKGLAFQQAAFPSPLLGLGILSNKTDAFYQKALSFVSNYGSDAVRLTLWEEDDLTPTNLTARWRFINKLWLAGQKMPPVLKTNWQAAVYAPLLNALHQNKLKDLWIALKSAFHQTDELGALAPFFYPFAPYVIQSLCPEIHEKMADLYETWQKIALARPYFVEINGRFCETFYSFAQTPAEIEKEAFSLQKLQNKLQQQKIKKIIHIPNKGLNIVI